MNEHQLEQPAVDRLLAAANPQPTPEAETVASVWKRVVLEVDSEQKVVPLRRGWRRPVVVTSAVALALAASAAAVIIPSRTGAQQPTNEVAAGGPGEIWRLDGTDFAAELAKASSDIPFPSETARAAAIAQLAAEAAELGSDHDSFTSRGAERAEVARRAICAWTTVWHDPTQRHSARSELRGALHWRAVTDVDPTPAIDGDDTDGGTGPTIFGHLPGIIRAAESEDAKQLSAAVDVSGWCFARPTRPATDQPPTERVAPDPSPTTWDPDR